MTSASVSRQRRASAVLLARRAGAIAFCGLVLTGCVAAAERRPKSSEAAAGAPPVDGERSAGQVLAQTPVAPPDEPDGPAPDGEHVWVRGYWHWDGVRYAWRPGRWERARPGYTR
jgi:hypothetical protein